MTLRYVGAYGTIERFMGWCEYVVGQSDPIHSEPAVTYYGNDEGYAELRAMLFAMGLQKPIDRVDEMPIMFTNLFTSVDVYECE